MDLELRRLVMAGYLHTEMTSGMPEIVSGEMKTKEEQRQSRGTAYFGEKQEKIQQERLGRRDWSSRKPS